MRNTIFEDKNAGAVSPPIYLSTTFERAADGSYPHHYIYARSGNPNRDLLENSAAQLENGHTGIAFSSGMAAMSALFQALRPGDHVLMPDDAYFTGRALARDWFGKWGLAATEVDQTDLTAVAGAIRKNTRLIWVESPSNPQLKIADIRAIAQIARQTGAICAVDNTWATPVFQRPLDLGADVVMHATTKYFGGHSDVLGGILILPEHSEWAPILRDIQETFGNVPSPFECWLTTRGIKTLALRVRKQAENAFELAQFLARHPKIEAVHYPGLPDHPQHHIAKKQMDGGFGAMLSVQIKGSAQSALRLTGKLELFTAATSLGAVESLIEHRKSVEGPDSPTPDNLLRLSVGIEHIEDLKQDWLQALDSMD
ncbi:MAG: aminotransferase class I/II-fold pyridoxal phosphate-dependent enzyme [Bacteroidetes bacterium]|nr:MAG: aminotransferase class I/II-fold pyridoxal phosphate-dependent enzyme [Bacteroidota bacterium]